ncbi:autotransporter beta-domain protein [Legionella oakridgensis ATCC 33761 = DSM 21215]|uniref:Autotransporter beta-domain protein n=3 Tax=Legionella oakridgensis TaxID=29423 RepID=W0BAI0_9GAMM|nr:autotransporter beta-domain protein [Legionella oakridgensis ATCC 33761 = DSM 21215]ETO92794.1 autotransporter beta-domain protein [Legionella oakridgensis RV-2-2007]KTD37099.1 Outer membrane protein B precursor [Legionella oakridgensis]STY20591.1 rOmp B [Legionella longbeachae]
MLIRPYFPNIKSPVLKAIVAIVLAFTVDIAVAAPCPMYITTSIPGVCEVTSGSVTVTNTGSVGGIEANDSSIGSIRVLKGGHIVDSNNAGSGITIEDSTVSGNISNAGSISAYDTGIAIFHGSSVTGEISNTGSISTATGSGIVVEESTVSGGILNAGSISAYDTGIAIFHDSPVTGGISNVGSISTATGSGILVEESTVSGSISNTGSMSAGDTGIAIFFHSFITEGISNTGPLSAANGSGIVVEESTVLEGISNTSSISAHDAGIAVFFHSLITEGISNAGMISATDGSGIVVEESTISGSISNVGSISAHDAGIAVFFHSFVRDIFNTGPISTINGSGIVVEESTVSGNIFNAALVFAHDAGIAVFGRSSVSGGISNAGLLSAATGSGILVEDSTVSQGISNMGLISAQDAGIAIFRDSSITGGISNGGTIQGGQYAIFVDNTSRVSKLDIIGQRARIIGNVFAENTDVNITAGAHFTSEGAFNVQNFNIQSAAFFNMANSITTGTLVNRGILSLGVHSQSLAGTGHYTQEATGLLQIGAKNTTNYGKLSAAGTVNLTNSGAFDVQLTSDSSFRSGNVLYNVIRGNLLTPPTDDYTVTDNSYLWTFTAETNADNGVNLTIKPNPEAYFACSGTYCANAASVIIGQVTSGNTSFSPFVPLPTATDFCTAAAQSTPELFNENIQITRLISRSVMDNLPMWSTLHGRPIDDNMLYQPGQFWLKPYASFISQQQRTSVNGYHANAYGVMFGKDMQLPDNGIFGAALAGGYDKVQGKTVLDGQSIKTNAYQAFIYATNYFPNNVYLTGEGSLGLGFNNSERFMPLFNSTAKGNYHSWFTNFTAELGRGYALTQRLLFTPALNASYMYVNQTGFTENGSVMALKVQGNNNNSFLLGADTHLAYHVATSFASQSVILTAHAGIAYDVLNNQPVTAATFLAGGPTFSTYGIQYDDVICRAGIGLSLGRPKSPFSLTMKYDLQNGNDGYSGFLSMILKYKN